MILGKITGKITTNDFKFTVEKETKKFEYVQVYHKAYEYVLCQVIELETDHEKTIAYCQILGYKDKGRIKKIRIPFEPNTEVLKAEDEFIRKVIKLEESSYNAFVGRLDGKEIPVQIDLNKVLTMHLAVLAKSGSGKSYSVGVLLEEMLNQKIPLLIIDPHGEYNTLKYKNTEEKDLETLKKLGLKPESFEVEEFGDSEINKGVKPIKLGLNMDQEEITTLLPKLPNSQLALIYSVFKNMQPTSLDSLILGLDSEESANKYHVINQVEYLRDLNIFTTSAVNYAELIRQGKASILNLKGIPPEVQEIIVYKITKELFELRKKEKIPPFFLVVEEAHNYCPERSFGETKASKILRTIASEGRKFGLGLCVISQRPARVDKSVLSQCSSQFILKVTNPNDLKAISSSVEGITNATEKEIQNLMIGQALVTGVSDMPILVNIRPRKTMHGGTAKPIMSKDFKDIKDDFKEQEFIPLIKPDIEEKDAKLMSKSGEIIKKLIPCTLIECEDKENYNLLIDMITGNIITDKNEYKTKKVPDMQSLTKKQVEILKYAFKNKVFQEQEIEQKQELKDLINKGLIIKEKQLLKLSQEFAFTKLSNFKTYQKPSFETINYDQKLKPKMKNLNKLKTFTTIKNEQECFLLKYEEK
ncbi:MAG: ATP-binding protein [Candidatus Woesearchaeota archaeon]